MKYVLPEVFHDVHLVAWGPRSGHTVDTAEQLHPFALYFATAGAKLMLKLPVNLDEVHLEILERVLRTHSDETLEWREVRSLLREVGKVAWLANGDYKVTSHGRSLILPPPPTRFVDVAEDRVALCNFFKQLSQPETRLNGHDAGA